MYTAETKNKYIKMVEINIKDLFKNNKQTEEVKEYFKRYGVSGGHLQSLINNPEKLEDEDIRLVALIGEQLFLRSGIQVAELKMENYFTENEISEIRQYYFEKEDDTIDYPIVIENVTEVNGGWYSFPLSYQLLARLYNSQKLNYNPDVQRQPKYIKRKDNVIQTPFINQNSVKEIKKHILNQTLVPTSIVLNAALGSSELEEELMYDKDDRTLTITDGTRLDIIDGMHRTVASVGAYDINKNLNINFSGTIFNYNTKGAKAYQAQLAKANPIPKSRIEELEENRFADIIVQQLRINSDLKSYITSRDKFRRSNSELVSYGVLAGAIDKEFKIKNKMEAIKTAEYLCDYFMYLFGTFDEYVLDEKSLLFYNKMFAGHIRLARKMKDNDIPLEILSGLNIVRFFRGNKYLEMAGVTKDGVINSKSLEKSIEKFIDECIYPDLEEIKMVSIQSLEEENNYENRL